MGNLDAYAEIRRGLLADDPSMGAWLLRGAMKKRVPRHRGHYAAVARSA